MANIIVKGRKTIEEIEKSPRLTDTGKKGGYTEEDLEFKKTTKQQKLQARWRFKKSKKVRKTSGPATNFYKQPIRFVSGGSCSPK